ncbi:MAG: carboxypeptidase-like regulatory domain-containing protein [Tenacibaculum sp.]
MTNKKVMVYKSLKCKINLILIFLLASFVCFSQSKKNKISGAVLSNTGKALSYANITVYNENETKLISYAISYKSGKYNLELENGIYLFKVSYLGYKPFSVKRNIAKDEVINFSLAEDATSLDEVVIKAKSLDVSIRNDTIKYNLKRLTSGSEENLKDILNKLPGVEIDKSGKIKANGKKIDKLLIEGKEFFGEQHQLATENIGAEMVKGISLLENFNDFSDLENQTKSGKTAMNIEIGEDYKGKIKGNLFIAGGFDKKYEINTNLFSFKKKTNLFFIGSVNNIGNQTFTFEDYISFQGGIQKFLSDNSSSTSISAKDLPPYLFSNNNVKSKTEQFSALNFSYNPSNSFKLNSYVIFDRVNITENQLAIQTYITNNQNIVLNLNNTKDNTFLVNNSFVNAVYKPSKKSIIEYTFNFSPQNNNLVSEDIFDQINFNTKRNNTSYALNNRLNYKQKVDNYLFSSTIYHGIRNNNEELNIFSNDSFLDLTFQYDDYSSFQNSKSLINNLGLNSFISKKIKKNTSVKVKYNLSKSFDTFKSNIEHNLLDNDITLNILENIIGLSFYNKGKTFVNYDIGANYSVIRSNKTDNYNFLPFVNLKFNFKRSHFLDLSYKRTTKLPQADNLLENRYISNFNTLISNQNLQANSIAKYDNFNLRYFIYDLFSGTQLIFGTNFVFGKDVIATNTINFIGYRINKFVFGKTGKSINSHLLFNKRFSKIPFSIKLKNTFSSVERNNLIDSNANSFSFNILSNDIKILSNFKKSLFDFELGFKRKQNTVKSKSINNKLILSNPYFNVFVNYNGFSLTIKNSVEIYNSNALNQQFHRINPVLNYKTKNKKWTLYIKGNDILNINKNFIIENTVYENYNYFEEKTVSTLGGFIITGLKYKF